MRMEYKCRKDTVATGYQRSVETLGKLFGVTEHKAEQGRPKLQHGVRAMQMYSIKIGTSLSMTTCLAGCRSRLLFLKSVVQLIGAIHFRHRSVDNKGCNTQRSLNRASACSLAERSRVGHEATAPLTPDVAALILDARRRTSRARSQIYRAVKICTQTS
jgi:hypothetical protein